MQRQEIQNLLRSGYSYKGIKKYFLKKYRCSDLSIGDILVIEKAMKLNRSKKEKDMSIMVNSVLNNKTQVKKIKLGILLFFIAFFVLLICIGLLINYKVALICACAVIFIICILALFSYMKFFKGKRKLK